MKFNYFLSTYLISHSQISVRRGLGRSVVYFLADGQLLLVQFDGLLVVAHCAVSVAHVAVGAAHSGAVTQRSRNRQMSLKLASKKCT
jgi:hypothetical protein